MNAKKRISILVIDDDASVRNSIKRILELDGFKVTLARDTDEGQAEWRKNPKGFNVIITDIEMAEPGKMSGVEFIKMIRQSGDNIPVIFISGNLKDHARQITDVSHSTGLLKPFNVDWRSVIECCVVS